MYRGQGQDFLVKMKGLPLIEGVSTAFHWYVIFGFGSNNAPYSARLPFIMFIFFNSF